MTRLWTALAGDRRGTTSVEYAVIAGLTGLALIAAMAALGDALLVRYGEMESLLVRAGDHSQ